MYHNRSDIISISIFFCHVQLGCIVMSTDNQKLISKDQIFPNDKTIHCFTARFLCLKISAESSQGTNHTCTEQLSKHQGFLVPKWDFWSSVVVCTILIIYSFPSSSLLQFGSCYWAPVWEMHVACSDAATATLKLAVASDHPMPDIAGADLKVSTSQSARGENWGVSKTMEEMSFIMDINVEAMKTA